MFNRTGRNIEKIFMAVAFAEAGEHEIAREIIREYDQVADNKQTLCLDSLDIQVEAAGFDK